MADHTALLTECERAIGMARQTVPMSVRSEEVWESLHKRVRLALGLPWTTDEGETPYTPSICIG